MPSASDERADPSIDTPTSIDPAPPAPAAEAPEADTTAYSIEGRTFAFRGPVATHLHAGGYVALRLPDGAERLGQVLEVRPVPGRTFAEPAIEGSGALLGSATDEGAFANATVHPASAEQVGSRVGHLEEVGVLTLGTLVDVPEVPAVLAAKGLGRHTFVCGQSGSGKTYAMGKVLERVLQDTDLRIFVLDPNSDYVHLGSLLDPSDTDLTDEQYVAAHGRHAAYADGVKVLGRDAGLRLWLGNLTMRQQTTVLGLDPLADAEETDVARRIMESLPDTHYAPGDIRQRALELDEPAAARLALRIGNLGLDTMDIWADADHPAVVEQIGDDWRAVVFDLGSLRTPRERSIVSAAVVTAAWEWRHARQPVLLVVDEAHNVCPQVPTDPQQALATEHLVTIAGEGRKFGIYLMVATQRPTKVHENVLSQCDNLVLMRMNSRADIAHLSSTFSAVPASLVEQSSVFRLGEGLAFGKIAPDPLLFRTGRRLTPEGGVDVPTTWLEPS